MLETLNNIAWPPEYRLIKHRRARSVKISTSKKHGLQITVPYRFSLKEIPAILENNKAWVISQLIILQSKKSDELPLKISLNAINEVWKVSYLATNRKLQIICRPTNEIVLVGNIQDIFLCKQKLTAWVKQKAKELLPIMLDQTSQRINLPYKKVIIRDQTTRWGSCTSDKSISLNFKLLFLPPHVATHIMIHELCHTIVLNHSAKFWDLVTKHDPLCQQHKKAMKQAEEFIPAWL